MVNGDHCNGLISLHNLGSMIPYVYIYMIYILNYICILNKIHYLADTTAPSPSTLGLSVKPGAALFGSLQTLVSLKQTNCTSGFLFANPMLIKVPNMCSWHGDPLSPFTMSLCKRLNYGTPTESHSGSHFLFQAASRFFICAFNTSLLFHMLKDCLWKSSLPKS